MKALAIVGAASAALTLAACGERVRIAVPPAELLQCADAPQAPNLPAIDWTAPVDQIKPVQRERDVTTLSYVLSLRSAWGDCAGKVSGTRAWANEVR